MASQIQWTWFQDSRYVYLHALIPVSLGKDPDYSCSISGSSVTAEFGGLTSTIVLLSEIDDKKSTVAIKGNALVFKLLKQSEETKFWPRASKDAGLNNLKINWDRWIDEDDKEFDKIDEEKAASSKREEFNQNWFNSTMTKLEKGSVPEKPAWRQQLDEAQAKSETETANRVARLTGVQDFLNWLLLVAFHAFVVFAWIGILATTMWSITFSSRPFTVSAMQCMRLAVVLSCPVFMADLIISVWKRLDFFITDALWRRMSMCMRLVASCIVVNRVLDIFDADVASVSYFHGYCFVLLILCWSINCLYSSLPEVICLYSLGWKNDVEVEKRQKNVAAEFKALVDVFWWMYNKGTAISTFVEFFVVLGLFFDPVVGNVLSAQFGNFTFRVSIFVIFIMNIWSLHTRNVIFKRVKSGTQLPYSPRSFLDVKLEYLAKVRKAKGDDKKDLTGDDLLNAARSEINQIREHAGLPKLGKKEKAS